MNKITDVCIRTDIEIQKAYVSSVGDAGWWCDLVWYAWLMVVGRVKEKKNTMISTFLIFTYNKDSVCDQMEGERAGVSLATRMTNKRRRMADESICKPKRKLNTVDVIADDRKLIKGNLVVVKKITLQRGAGIV